ncbi:hypothetical protein DPMN_158373 [Dreissena polymorpha]|uniref:NACHT domain-containing protein n=1 Tax=Dreissena polymorpha TaxID=45954 RepID=A0A9D4EIZ3_DREPO|nr:hypothetical protein DPMN_158373 [Dreissena polymorpha]
MASLADVFKEKKRLNWLKAWLAIDIAKSGLEHLADNEAQTFHQHIYNQVTSTLKSQSATCTSCNTTNLLRNQKCPNQICDKVCQAIIKEHRYTKCSWNNTSAPLWQTHYWEIAKCYIQTDGYADKISIQDTDFNGVVSFMLNCTRFDRKFSFPITMGRPTLNKPACLLYKAREVHKAVRHSSLMEVTDVDLQDYFTTLNNLLKDSSHLSQDNVAKNAVVKLAQLEKDTLLLTTTEMMCFLDAVGTTLKQHLKGIAKDVVDASVNDLRVNTELCIDKIKDFMSNCKQELAKQADIHKQDIDEHVDSKKQGIDDHTGRLKQGMDEHADRHKQGLNEHADRHKQGMDEHADRQKQDMDEHAGRHKQSIDKHADRHKQGIDEHASRHKQCLYKQAEKCIKDIQEQFGNTTFTETTYKQSCEEMLGALTKYYRKRFCHINIFPLDDWTEEKLLDIYMPPNIQLMAKEGGHFKKTGEQILKYKNILLSDTEPNQHIFIQGEAGYGKSTFLAKLVMDWCTITSEQSAETTLPIDDKTTRFSSYTHMRYSNVFDDLTSLKDFKFVFHVTLRESVGQFEIEKMINTQIVDSIYSSEEDRGKAYMLLNEIMKRERCFVLLDGLDEWFGTRDHHNLPTLADVHSLCVLLITTRPWKMTEAKILDSQICKLLQLDGVNNVFEVSRKILGCRKEFKGSQDLDKKQSEFESYVRKYGLLKHLYSPMMLCLIVHSWTKGTELKGSICEKYSLLLECLFKKANTETSEFQEPPYRCFTETQNIQPNIEHLNRLAEAAFYLLFSDSQEKALVFTITELKIFNLGQLDQDNFALKSGILSATRKSYALRSSSSFSFIHKSIQEFLAAYHIACNTNLIDDVISGYLNRHKDGYLGISQVFIFLCGLNISAANKLSGMMDEHDVGCLQPIRLGIYSSLQNTILAGFREAVANQQKDIVLKLSVYYFNVDNDMQDLHNIWTNNKSSVLSMVVYCDRESSATRGESASQIEFDLSSCMKLKSLVLNGKGILLIDCASTSTAEHPVGIVLKSADPFQCADPPPVLPSIEDIKMSNVTCSSTFLRSLFSTLLTLDHVVTCDLPMIYIECEEAAEREIRAFIYKELNKSITIQTNNVNPHLFNALHGLNIKDLSLSVLWGGFNLQHVELQSQSLSSLTQLEKLSIEVGCDNPGLWKALYGLNIKSLSLSGFWEGLCVKNVESMSQSLSSLTQLETLSIEVKYDSPWLWKALHGLNIKSLSLRGFCEGLCMKNVELQSKSLSSLTQLETLSIKVEYDSPGLWKVLYGLNIKSLSLRGFWEGLCVKNVESLSQSLSSLTQLETLSIEVKYDSPCLWMALHGLNIKSLSLRGFCEGLCMKHVELQLKSLSSLTQLETLSIKVEYDSPGLWKALHGLNIKSLSLRAEWGGVNVENVELLSQSLSSLTQLETLSIEVQYDSPGLLKAVHGLNIKSLSLRAEWGGVNVENVELQSQSLPSLTQLETLSIKVGLATPGLWKALHGLNIKSLSIYEKGLNADHDELLSQALESLTQLETLTLHVKTYKQLKLPQSLKDLNIYCNALLPSEVLELVDTLPTRTQRIESNLKLCCSLEFLTIENIPLEEYTAIQQELETRKNVTVERFKILHGRLETIVFIHCQ